MIRLALANLGLNIVTLSFWRFWGRTKVRHLLWDGTTVWDDPLEYTGTGKELFKGFLLALVVIYLPLVAGFGWAQSLIAAHDPRGQVVSGILYMVTALLVAAGLYRARRYQLSRTVWRGIRGGQTGSAWGYALRSLAVWLAVALSLGLALPWGEMMLARYRFNHTTFGDRSFQCEALAKGLYGRFALVWLAGLLCVVAVSALIGAVITLGLMVPGPPDQDGPPLAQAFGVGMALLAFLPVGLIVMSLPMAWYRAAFFRQLAAGTSFEGHRFSAEVKTWPLARLAVGNVLISLFSLGILRPWAALRVFRFTCAAIAIDGVPDFAAIHQTADKGPRTGEGLISVLDGAGEF